MAKRIRYEKHPTRKNVVISMNIFTSKKTGARYKLVLDFDAMTYHIRNERNKEFVVNSKSYGNMNVLKRNARAHLEKIGVPMSRESRDRTFGLCDKNYSQKKHEENEN